MNDLILRWVWDSSILGSIGDGTRQICGPALVGGIVCVMGDTKRRASELALGGGVIWLVFEVVLDGGVLKMEL